MKEETREKEKHGRRIARGEGTRGMVKKEKDEGVIG